MMRDYSPWQFTLFRLLLGGYLAFHFAELVPYAVELFGVNGVIRNPSLNFTAGLFPNPYALALPDLAVSGSLVALALAAVAFALGWRRRVMALVLWFGWTALFHRNNLISNPSLPYIGLLLVLSTLVPLGEPWAIGTKREARWAMPKWVFRTAWVLMALGYSFSGWTKLASASWLDGSALNYLLLNPLARPGWCRDVMLALPPELLVGMTWGVLALEVLYAPLALWRAAQPWLWWAMVAMHIGILTVVDFSDLTLGMLMIHAFTCRFWFTPTLSTPRFAPQPSWQKPVAS